MRRILFFAGFAFALCVAFDAQSAKKIPLTDATFQGEVAVRTNESVRLDVTTFDPGEQRWTTLATGAGAYVPVSGKVKPEFLFSAQDQRELAAIILSELRRHGIVGTNAGDSGQDILLELQFKDGSYKPTINEYGLTVTMRLSDANGRGFERTYLLDSNAKSTRWGRLNTSVWKGKMQLVQVALDTLVPDIQIFLADVPVEQEQTS